MRCLLGYRRELVQSRTGHINRLHADLEKIRCGYHRTISAITSDKALTRVMRLLSGDTGARANVARGRVRHIRQLNRAIHTAAITQIARRDRKADNSTNTTSDVCLG